MPQILEKCSFSEAEENFISFLLRYEDVCTVFAKREQERDGFWLKGLLHIQDAQNLAQDDKCD